MPTIFAWTADLSPKGRVALGLGTMLMALEIGIGSGAFVSGTLFASDHTYLPSIYLFCAVFGGVASCVLWWVTARNKKLNKSPIGVE